MNFSVLYIMVIAGLLLIVGLIAIVTIALVCKRCRDRVVNEASDVRNDESVIDPWIEAGKRLKDPQEHE